MGKKLDITPKIKAAMDKSTDNSVDPNSVSVFETICCNTLPVNKRGLFNGAIMPQALLQEMADYVNSGGFVPMHTLHQQGWEMPVGRMFAAEVTTDQNGMAQLNGLFYIGNENNKLVAGIDNASTDEVSVGVSSQHLNCSVCGFDYLGADATSDNIYGQVCANGHEIGVDGTHLILNGLQRWMETSLISLGAAKGAKILSRTKSLMGADSYEKLAASGVAPEATVLFTSLPFTTNKQEPKMDIKELVTLNASLSADKAVADHKVADLTGKVTQLTAERDQLTTDLATAKAAIPADAAKTTADLKASQDALAASTTYIRKEADRLCVAAGVEKLPEAATFTELTASIDTNRTKLSSMFGKNSQAAASGSGTNASSEVRSNAASFKTR